jgi:hypothetical protein
MPKLRRKTIQPEWAAGVLPNALYKEEESFATYMTVDFLYVPGESNEEHVVARVHLTRDIAKRLGEWISEFLEREMEDPSRSKGRRNRRQIGGK